MKFRIIMLALVIAIAQSSIAQRIEKNYPIVVKFESICCGVPKDSAVKLFIASFKKQYRIKKITASHLGPMGREGEYYLMFRLNELNKKQAAAFVSRIQHIKPLASDKGQFGFEEKMEIDPANVSKRSTITTVVF